MKQLFGYTLTGFVGKAGPAKVYGVIRPETGESCHLHLLESTAFGPVALARLEAELHRSASLETAGMVKWIDMKTDNDQVALIVEDFQDAISLKSIVQHQPMPAAKCLQYIIGMAATLTVLHQSDFFHGNVNSHNVFVQPSSGILKIGPLDICQWVSGSQGVRYPAAVASTAWPYISPEQTGRMNRLVDYRTDFYSVGIVMYEMLTGGVPFEAANYLEFIHAHLARRPQLPSAKGIAVPEMVSDVVMKLLAKAPEDRYQSSVGLASDLKECLRRLLSGNRNQRFPLAKKDVGVRYRTSDTLYGRESEKRVLEDAHDRLRQGAAEVVFVTGEPGIGKSALIHSACRQFQTETGYYVRAKYDVTARDVPYSGIVGAFRRLASRIATESSERLAWWRQELLAAVGGNGRVIADVIPEIEQIIGRQPAVPKLGPQESVNRFRMVFNRFVKAFATEERPLTVFLDDLQWADPASLTLIKDLISDTENRYLLLIGAYRKTSAGRKDRQADIVEALRQDGIAVREIALGPLTAEQTTAYVTHFFKSPSDHARPLAQLVHTKTNGNPFFIKQFIHTLFSKRLIFADAEGDWCWDLPAIVQTEVTDNVIDLMAAQIASMDRKSKTLLATGACLGHRFDLDILTAVTGEAVESVLDGLNAAMAKGLIIYREHRYQFHHDRIQEAAYRLTPKADRPALHLAVGRAQLKRFGGRSLRGHIFEIVRQLNKGAALLNDPAERDDLAGYNLVAGESARSNAAYEAAFTYFTMGIDLLGDNGWQRHYDLALALHNGAIESAYLTTRYSQMEDLSAAVLTHARVLLDRITAFECRIKACVAQNRLRDAVDIGLTVLAGMGVRFPKTPGAFRALLGFVGTAAVIRGRPLEKLIEWPEMRDAGKLAMLRIMSGISASVYYSKPELTPLLVCKMVNLSVRYGNTQMSPFHYAVFGMMLCTVGRLETGYRFGRISLGLLDKETMKASRGRSLLIVNGFIRHWKEAARDSKDGLLEAYRECMDVGDLEFAANALMLYCWVTFQLTKDLEAADYEVRGHIDTLKTIKQTSQFQLACLCHQLLSNLRNPGSDPAVLAGDSYNESRMLPLHAAAGDRTSLCSYHVGKMILHFLFEQHESAVMHADKAEAQLDAFAGLLLFAGFHFFDSLARLAVYPRSEPTERRRILRKVSRNQKKMKRWAAHAPANFQQKYLLVNAELEQLRGNRGAATDAYCNAIETAARNGYLLDEALACELAAKYFRQNGDEWAARLYLTEACALYVKWGAESKVRHLETAHGGGLRKPERTRYPADLPYVDHLLVVKALQSISVEIVLESLLKKLLKTMIEIAGAGRVVFVSVKGSELLVEAERRVGASTPGDGDGVTLAQQPLERFGDILLPAVYYVHRTARHLVVEDAGTHDEYAADDYVKRSGLKSLLCLPVIRNLELTGILYLENSQAAGVFTEDRVEILRLLSSQAAISIENAGLYKELSETESALRKSESQYRFLADNVTDLIWVFDLQKMRFSYQTPSILSMFGYTAEEAQHLPLEAVLSESSYDLATAALEEELALSSESQTYHPRLRVLELKCVRKDGEMIWVESSMRFMRGEKGEADRVLGVSRDITARKKAEAKIKQMNIELERRVAERTEDLERSLSALRKTQHQLVQSEKMAALGNLVAGVAHEINTPLGIGVTAATFLKDKTMDLLVDEENKNLPPVLRRYVDTAVEASSIIHNNLNRAADLVNSFRNVAVDQIREDRRRFQLKDYLQDVIQSLHPKVRRNGHRIVVNCPSGLEVTSYPGVFSQIITNLVMNSLTHGFEGRSQGEIRLDCASEDDWLKIVYRDNGRGMDRETSSKIFEPFFTTRRNRGGTGLGMHILFNLVTQSLKGEVSVTSEPGKGAAFSIRIPQITPPSVNESPPVRL